MSRNRCSLGFSALPATILHALAGAPVMAASLLPGDGQPLSYSSIAKKTMPVVVNIATAQRPPRWSGGGSFGGRDPFEEFFNRFFGEGAPKGKGHRRRAVQRKRGDHEIFFVLKRKG